MTFKSRKIDRTRKIYFISFLVLSILKNYFKIRGGSLKKIAKKIIPNVPINKKVYTKASIKRWVVYFFL